MKRKIVKQGAATMTISLPAPWIKKFSLEVGDELDIIEKGNKLEISAEKISEKKTIEIDATKTAFTKNDLTHLYMIGYDEIIVKFKENLTLKNVKERIPECIGFEIFDQTEDRIVIKSISSGLDEEFDTILRKVFLLLKEMSENTLKALSKKEFERLKQIREMEHLNNRFVVFLERTLNKGGYKKYERIMQMYDMLQNLERTADEYKFLCDSFADYKSNIKKESLQLLKEVNDYYALFYNMYYKFEPEKKNLLYIRRKALKKRALESFKKGQEQLLNHHLIGIIERIYNSIGSFLALKEA